MCRCTDCWEQNKTKPYPELVIVPFANGARNPEPFATLAYGGVTIELPLTLVHKLRSTIHDPQSVYWDSLAVLSEAIHEIECRMWSACERGAHASRHVPGVSGVEK